MGTYEPQNTPGPNFEAPLSYRPLTSSRGRSLFSGARRGQPLLTTSGLPAGGGAVGTAENPSPQIPGVTTGLKSAYKPTPNSGGLIQRSGQAPVRVPTDPGYNGVLPTGQFGAAGAAEAQGRIAAAGGRAQVGGGPLPVAPAQPVNRPAQTERANPLTNGGGSPQVEGTSVPVAPPTIDPGKALGYVQRGNRAPGGTDLNPGGPAGGGGSAGPDGWIPGDPNAPGGQLAPQPGDQDADSDLAKTRKDVQGDLAKTREGVQGDLAKTREDVQGDLNQADSGHIGGSGDYAQRFSSPQAADIYTSHVNQLFGGGPSKAAKSPSMLTRTGPRDNGTESDGGEDY